MLISPKWQTMWMESQHCSKSIVNAPLHSQQAERVLEDLRTHCSSPIKAVQLEALKCWGMWIHNQEPEEWKLNTVCFAAVRPLIPKKIQPLLKDVDICTLKLSLMWALLVKVQNIIHLEGPQYILEVFLQSCLTWLSSPDDECESHISSTIFQLLLRLFKKDEVLSGIDNDEFPPLTADVLHSKKTFHRLAEKFVKVFVHWRKVQEKTVILKLWRHFLEHCELSYEHIPVPIWHKIFKQAGEIFSEKDEPVKERLAFLHGCATALKSALSSSKFIDFGNLLTSPCEALLKKLVELCCTVVPDDCSDSEMFYYSKEICQVLSVKSVALGGYVLCISVLDVLDEFWLRDLFWGVWCGLVYCYKILLQDIDQSEFTKVQTKFYRKLRGVAVNFELDRNNIHKDCINEVEEHISVLNIGCLCASKTFKSIKDSIREEGSVELMDTDCHSQPSESPPVTEPASEEVSKQIVQFEPTRFYGKFSNIIVRKRLTPRKSVNLNFDLIEDILKTVGINFLNSSLNCSFTFMFIKLQRTAPEEPFRLPRSLSLQFRPALEAEQEMKSNVPCAGTKTPSPVPECVPSKRNCVSIHETQEDEGNKEIISTPLTRSRRRAEEERERELERQTRRKRKSFEDLVQEILQKNKERKTEKNSKRKSPLWHKGKRNKKKARKPEKDSESKPPEASARQLRNSKKEEPKKEKNSKEERKKEKNSKEEPKKEKNSKEELKKEKNSKEELKKEKNSKEEPKKEKNSKEEPKKEKMSKKTDGKLENYFKVLSKKSEKEVKKEEKKPYKKKKGKENKRENSCCKPEKEEGEKKGEIGWRQTSLKTMMNQKSQIQGRLRTRKNKMAVCPLAKLSPFKDVLHDHEYVKIDPQRLEESVLFTQKCKVEKSEEEGEKVSKHELNEPQVPEMEVTECEELEMVESEILEQSETEPMTGTENSDLQEKCETLNANEVVKEDDSRVKPDEENPSEEVGIIEETPIRRGIKRMRTCEDHVPNKRMKLEVEDQQEEKFLPEIAEKENLEERQPPREKVGSSALNTMSRALRMIALVPESTKGGQIQRESLPRVEAFKSKKVPNVDRSSRASKMLALLSENVVEVEEVCDMKAEDVSSWGELATTPNAKTPASSLKSPKSVKKRRSIRFDDAKNETVLYQTDTPPSQILEEKEKSRRNRFAEITVICP